MRALLPLLAVSFLSAQNLPPKDFASRADTIVQSWLRDGLYRGTVLVFHAGGELLHKGYGNANDEWSIPNSPHTKFRIGSITKQFTAAAILQLVEQGKLRLDDPVKKHYPGAPGAWDAITIRHLLNHTSGIPSYTAIPGFMANRVRQKLSPPEIVNLTQNEPLEFEPGTKYKYNNSAYVLLGAIIESITGSTYEEYLRKTVLGPAGMADSGYDSHLAVIPHRASGYTPDGSNADFIDMSLPHGAGALYATTGDLRKWCEALYGGKLINQESLQLMTTPGLNDYGFGLLVKSVNGHSYRGHGGGIHGFNTQLMHFPAETLTIAVLGNQNGTGPDQIAMQLARLFFGEDIQPRSDRSASRFRPDTSNTLRIRHTTRSGP